MKAPLLLTLGEPAGIGPEIAVKACDRVKARFAVIGCADTLERTAKVVASSTNIVRIETLDQLPDVCTGALPVLDRPLPSDAIPGQPQPDQARSVIDWIEEAIDLCRTGQAAGIVTNPINKNALHVGAGFAHPGHTEFLAYLSGIKCPVMMLAGPDLRVVPVTIHIALSDVPAALTPELLKDTIRITHKGLQQDFGIDHPRLAVAGLNPHAGEAGQMGYEEIQMITPVLNDLRGQKFNIIGPLPADTLFHAAARKTYDAAICMYHDQALIPIKTLNFDDGVNITLGLPFVRTSPDHGTAENIAGHGIARPDSLIAALNMAERLVSARNG